jgi:hypothetical protein
MLLRRAAFARAGGLEAIRGAIIDDCALAARMKVQGPIWLGLSDRVASLRAYHGGADIRRMVARTAYAQLRYSPLLLAGMLLALGLVFLLPPAVALFGGGAWPIGAATWLAMAGAYRPVLRRYSLSPAWGAALPAIAAAYMVFTLDSAWQEWRGRGGMWKGEPGPRADAPAGTAGATAPAARGHVSAAAPHGRPPRWDSPWPALCSLSRDCEP